MYNVPSVVIANLLEFVPSTVDLEDYTQLAASGTKSLAFNSFFNPFLSIWVFMDQAGTVQIQGRTQSTGSGSTYRNVGSAFNITASQLFVLAGYRVSPMLQVQVTLTNTGGSPTTTCELAVYVSSS